MSTDDSLEPVLPNGERGLERPPQPGHLVANGVEHQPLVDDPRPGDRRESGLTLRRDAAGRFADHHDAGEERISLDLVGDDLLVAASRDDPLDPRACLDDVSQLQARIT